MAITQMEYPCLPVGFCFSASIPLFMEIIILCVRFISIFHNVTSFFLLLCSTFELTGMQHLSYIVNYGTIDNYYVLPGRGMECIDILPEWGDE